MARKLLILDPDPRVQDELRQSFAGGDVALLPEQDALSALERVRTERPGVALIDMALPGKPGIELLREIKAIDPRVCVIMMSGGSATQNAIEAMKFGAYDYLTKPLNLDRLEAVVKDAFHSSDLTKDIRILGGDAPAAANGDEADVMIGSSLEMIEIWKMVGKVAELDATVLIQGESGTGKELLARSVYNNSRRKHKPFLAVNCAALPETLLESELFGHEKGAFTDAAARRIGRFEQCAGGTLFLDEVAEMSLKNQAKLLRVLESRQFERVGGNETLTADVRIIAATNRSLIQAVKEKSFRMDLYYRLKVVSIFLPPLRERQEDIPPLIDFFMQKHARESRKPPLRVSAAAMQVLQEYPWPGNIRELKNFVHSAVVFSRGDALLPEDVQVQLRGNVLAEEEAPAPSAAGDRPFQPLFDELSRDHDGTMYRRFIAEAEKELFRMAMQRHGNNEVHAAKFLGISRNTLRQRLSAHKLK